MQTVLTGWTDIPELRFDPAAQTLTVVCRGGETRVITSVSQGGFDRLIAAPGSGPTARRTNRFGAVWRALAFRWSRLLTGQLSNIDRPIAGGDEHANIGNGLLQ